MNKTSGTSKASADRLVKTIRRKTRQTYSAAEKYHGEFRYKGRPVGHRKLIALPCW